MALAVALAAGVPGCGHSAPGPIPASGLRGEVAFSAGDGDIWIADLRGGHRRRVVREPGPQEDPSFSPDGRYIVYRDSRRGYNVDDEIRVVAVAGGRSRRLTRGLANAWGPAWSPDGRLIAHNSGLQLHVVRPDGTGDRIVTAKVEAEYPAWSPDSRRLAFMSARPNAHGSNPDYDIYVVGRDGTGLRRLTRWPGEEGWPVWSPDGRWIAFSTTHDDVGQYEGGGPYRDIWVMAPDGSRKRRVLREAYGTLPAWAPDGRTILFSGARLDGRQERLWVVRPDGSGSRPLALSGGPADWRADD